MIDGIIGLIILISAWRGFRRGMVRAILSLVSWFVALALAVKFAQPLSILLTSVNATMALPMAFVIIVVCILLLTSITAWVITKILSILYLGFFNKLLGALFGAITGFIKVLVILNVLSPFLLHLPSWQESGFAQLFLPFAPVAKLLLFETAGETWEQIQNF